MSKVEPDEYGEGLMAATQLYFAGEVSKAI